MSSAVWTPCWCNVIVNVNVFSLGLSNGTEEQQVYSAIWDMGWRLGAQAWLRMAPPMPSVFSHGPCRACVRAQPFLRSANLATAMPPTPLIHIRTAHTVTCRPSSSCRAHRGGERGVRGPVPAAGARHRGQDHWASEPYERACGAVHARSLVGRGEGEDVGGSISPHRPPPPVIDLQK